jgi:hypothetical protein
MALDLKDLSDKGIFTESEITVIFDRRRQSEYLLRHKKTQKVIFLRYVKNEMNLERLLSIWQAKTMQSRVEKSLTSLKNCWIVKKSLHCKNNRSLSTEKRNLPRKGTNATKVKPRRSSGDTSIIQYTHLIWSEWNRNGRILLHFT